MFLVEGYFDPMITQAKGLSNVVGIGNSAITRKQIDSLKKYNITRVLLALDNDPAGIEGTEKSIKNLLVNGIETFVINFPKEYKDPDEYIAKAGIEFFQKDIELAINGVKCLSKHVLTKHNLNTDIGKRNALHEALTITKTIPAIVDREEFIKEFKQDLNFSDDQISIHLKEIEQQKQKEKHQEEWRDLVFQQAKLVNEGNFEALSTLKQPSNLSPTNSFIMGPYRLEDLQNDLLITLPGLKTGYAELDKYVVIPNEAITLLAGRPSHGKTAFTLNLLLNMIESYPNLNFYLFSYEETRQSLAIKIINILSEHIFGEFWKNYLNLKGYLTIKDHKNINTVVANVEAGKKQYDNYIKEGRLILVDTPYEILDLVKIIESLRKKDSKVGAIFIDYIQKIPNKGKHFSRHLELKQTSENILNAAKDNSLPIILGAQLARDSNGKDKVRLDNLRESGDLEQDADTVLGIYNPTMAQVQDQENDDQQLSDNKRVIEFHVTPLKNRNGLANKIILLQLNRATLKITN